MQRTITQYKSLHDLPICLHRSCNDFHYARENSTEVAYSTSNPNYEATIYITFSNIYIYNPKNWFKMGQNKSKTLILNLWLQTIGLASVLWPKSHKWYYLKP